MKRISTAIAFFIMATLVAGCASVAPQAEMKKPGTNINITTAGPFTLDKKGKLDLSGKGFVPGSNIVLIFNSSDGIKSDLSGSLKPEPKADANGAWATTWSYGRLVSKKIIKPGSYRVDIVNEDYATLNSVIVSFAK